MSDRALVERFRGGDTGAFQELMASHEDRVFSICLRVVRNRDLALDATQDTFINVFRRIDSFDGRAKFSTWLYRVAVNSCYDLLRKEQRRQTQPMPEHVDPADLSVDDDLEAVELRPELTRALGMIGEQFRDAIVLVDIEGLSIDEAADVLDVAPGTIKSRLYRGRRALAEHLGNLNTQSRRPTDESHA